MRWIALLFVLFVGCASSKVSRVSAGLCNGQPVIQVDFVSNNSTVAGH